MAKEKPETNAPKNPAPARPANPQVCQCAKKIDRGGKCHVCGLPVRK